MYKNVLGKIDSFRQIFIRSEALTRAWWKDSSKVSIHFSRCVDSPNWLPCRWEGTTGHEEVTFRLGASGPWKVEVVSAVKVREGMTEGKAWQRDDKTLDGDKSKRIGHNLMIICWLVVGSNWECGLGSRWELDIGRSVSEDLNGQKLMIVND